MSDYVLKIPILGMTLAQAKYITGQIYDAIDSSETIPGEVNNVYLTEGEISNSDIEQDEQLDDAYGEHYSAGRNDKPLPDDFPTVT